MNIRLHPAITDFIDSLDGISAGDTLEMINVLAREGHRLSMPFAKPIGNGLFELRIKTAQTIRILYGFKDGEAVLVVGIRKQRPRLDQRDLRLAALRLTFFS
ncbi:MAG: type II toxin-antitoxin system RelE/ParE family toxin [Candidatus Kaiserbacteria bacterium]|nr:type II toxin-antitoxin system RelE/ParE family toxin [Candidatus Kaiserbacteria bacterium]